ncbi:MAG: zinc-ribbon domain-containing protein, partial [Deltaproteobacteria bacterium]|nr:zinc-ribbon domain-containing protein [Deltaproteobacteria bacterium]
MIITCEECQTKFRVADELIKLTGTRVRCSNCQSVFTVFRPPQTLNPAQESRFDLDNLERTSLERTNLERNSLERNSPDQSFPEVLDQDLADLFAPDAPPSPQPPAAGPPVILARPPYPASRPLFAVDPALDPHFKDIASPLSPIPTPPNLRPPANLGLDDEPVATSLIKAPPPAPRGPGPPPPAPRRKWGGVGAPP